MNKKGFTLIEMLAAIAIIAVLVAIIVPAVSNSTKKAQAAADAANLRSAKAAIVVSVLNGDIDKASSGNTTIANSDLTAKGITVPVAKTTGEGEFKAVIDSNGNVTVSFGDHKIAHFAAIADGTANS